MFFCGKNLLKLAAITIAIHILYANYVISQTTKESWMQKRVGLGFNFGLQKLYCDDPHTGFTPAGEAYIRYLLTNRVNFALGLGYGNLSDGSIFDKQRYNTNLFVGDLRGNFLILTSGKFKPYLSLGAGVHNYQFTGNRWNPVTKTRVNDDFTRLRYNDAHSFVGGGIEVFLSPKVALNALADYRFVMTSPADAFDDRVEGDSKDGYLNLRAGLTFYFKNQLQQLTPQDEKLLANALGEQSENASPFSESSATTAKTEKFNEFEANVDRLIEGDVASKTKQKNAGETDLSMQQYLRLKARRDELLKRVEQRSDEILQLQLALRTQESQIRNLEIEFNELSSQPASRYNMTNRNSQTRVSPAAVEDFRMQYEDALNEYYANNYHGAISIFSDLLASQPGHKLAGNCQYWIGESYYLLRNYTEATNAFARVYDYPGSPKEDDAALMLGKCYLKTGNSASAREYLEKLVREHPNSEYLATAENLLLSLN